MKAPCGSKERLHKMAQSQGLPTRYTKKIIKEGWVSKTKGALQILFEQGWIDPLNIHCYSAKGKVGLGGGVEFSVDKLMQKQSDFTTEMTLLQYHASLLGVTLERSPNYHPEILGEGIEYRWALSKMEYRRSPIVEKKGKDGFLKLVRKCLDKRPLVKLNLSLVSVMSSAVFRYTFPSSPA